MRSAWLHLLCGSISVKLLRILVGEPGDAAQPGDQPLSGSYASYPWEAGRERTGMRTVHYGEPNLPPWFPGKEAIIDEIAAAGQELKLVTLPERTWDKSARLAFAQALRRRLRDLSRKLAGSGGHLERYLYVEGIEKRIPSAYRGSFFGAGCYPDAAYIVPGQYAIAIELDHGVSSARLKSALSKAAFCVLVGAYDCAVVVYVPHGRDLEIREIERRVLEFYDKQLKTRLVLARQG